MDIQRSKVKTATVEQQPTFKREIGLFGGVSILAGIMIGTGIFLSSGNALKAAYSSPLLTILIWFVAGLVSLLAGLCYAELGASIPAVGGSFVYLTKAYGEPVGFLAGFSSFLIGNSGSIAAIAVGFAGFLRYLIPMDDLGVKVVAISTVIILTIINCLGVKLGSIFQNVTMVGKLAPIILIILLGVFANRSGNNFDFSTIPANPISGISGALILSLWGYVGWDNLNTVAEEIKKPRRNIPLSIIIAILGVTAIYCLFNFALFRTLPVDVILGSDNPAGDAARVLIGGFGGNIIAIGILISMLGALNGCVLVFPRSYYAMAKDKVFFKSFGKLNPKYSTPINALIASAAVSILLILMGTFDQLATMVVFTSWVFTFLTIVAVFIFRKRYPDIERPYKVLGYPVIPIIALFAITLILISTLTSEFLFSIIGIGGTVIIGLPAYYLFKSSNKGGKA